MRLQTPDRDRTLDLRIEERPEGWAVVETWAPPGLSVDRHVTATLAEAQQRAAKIVSTWVDLGWVMPWTCQDPMLLTAIGDPMAYLTDEAWVLQPKWDGDRVRIFAAEGVVVAQSRAGKWVALDPLPMAGLARANGVLEGEYLNDRPGKDLILFDVLWWDGLDQQALPYCLRYDRLTTDVAPVLAGRVIVTPTFRGNKLRAFQACVQQGMEGVVVKHQDAPYIGGRCQTALKYKFYATATMYVLAHNAKRSVAVAVQDDAGLRPVGDVPIYPNVAVPPVGSLIEVRYLYAYPDSGHIAQPKYLRPRPDLSAPDRFATMQFKQA